ncbi:Facilitated trehalose transporter Tret1 [Frankliniella fusca]|uniref:Facilitated trehalose transporter Tret1 n=1 Tax=Frankliniella fusca TaxID=407009 RepID=A0AAE1H4W0_9NEOP|nr:Facilitated trehalose transporter Tret1 [Frankliniella fusca]
MGTREATPMVGLESGPHLQNGGPRPPRQEGSKGMQYLAGFLATLGALAAGTVLAWTAPVLSKLQEPDSWLPLSENEGSWVASLMTIGACIGAVPAGAITERFGRRGTMLLLAVPFVISWLLILFANGAGMLYAARFLSGFATGATSVAAPMYCAEIAEPSVRGTLGTFFQLQVTIGILVTFIVGGFASYTVLAGVSLAVPVLWFAAVMLLPETPVFLLKKSNTQGAKRALRRLRGTVYDGIDWEVAEMQRGINAAEANDSSLKDLLSSRAVVRALVICLGLMVFQQVSGINAVMFYAVTIFEKAGSSLQPEVATIIVGVVQVLATGLAAVLVERAGRRLLLLGSAALMALAHIVLGVYFHLSASGTDVSSIGWLPLGCVVLFVVVFSLAFGPIPWMMAGELFTDEVKAPASTIAAAVNWSMAFAVTKVFPTLMSGVGVPGTFWIFGGCCVAATVFVAVLVFETKGRSQAEVQDILGGKRVS